MLRFFRKGTTKAPAELDEVELRGNGQFQLEIKGESHYQANIASAVAKHGHAGFPATLVLEDDNRYDANAVRVEIDGLTVGYLGREVAPVYRRHLKLKGHPSAVGTCAAKVFGGSDEQKSFGVWLDIPVEVD